MNDKKIDFTVMKKLLCGLLCAMVCATATACVSKDSRPGLGEGTESNQVRDTEEPTAPPTSDPGTSGGDSTPPVSGGEQTSGSGDNTQSGGNTSGQNPDADLPKPTPTAAELIAACNEKMATSNFTLNSITQRETEGIGAATEASDVEYDQVSVRVEQVGVDRVQMDVTSASSSQSGALNIKLKGTVCYYDMGGGAKFKIIMTPDEYGAFFTSAMDSELITYSLEDFQNVSLKESETGYQVICTDPTDALLQEMLAVFGDTYTDLRVDDIMELRYSLDISGDGVLNREYLFIKFETDLNEEYGAGSKGIVRLSRNDQYTAVDTAVKITEPEDADAYIPVLYDQFFGDGKSMLLDGGDLNGDSAHEMIAMNFTEDLRGVTLKVYDNAKNEFLTYERVLRCSDSAAGGVFICYDDQSKPYLLEYSITRASGDEIAKLYYRGFRLTAANAEETLFEQTVTLNAQETGEAQGDKVTAFLEALNGYLESSYLVADTSWGELYFPGESPVAGWTCGAEWLFHDLDGTVYEGFTAVRQTVRVTVDALNLRTSADASGEENIYDTLPKGAELIRVAVGEEWSIVLYNGGELYVSNTGLTVVES